MHYGLVELQLPQVLRAGKKISQINDSKLDVAYGVCTSETEVVDGSSSNTRSFPWRVPRRYLTVKLVKISSITEQCLRKRKLCQWNFMQSHIG